tara:strand:- start:707 stop:1387 length:681 start_codon:yes stop_codon:yes gene_type:complete
MNDQEVEKEIEEKGLKAPRVTPEHVNSVISIVEYHVFANSTLTVCCITLDNGFTVTGESACASPENYDKQLGEKIAYDNAKSKIWMLEGYLLKDRLHSLSRLNNDVVNSTMAADYFTDFGKFFPEQGPKPTKPAEDTDNVMAVRQTALCVDGFMIGKRVSENRYSWKVADGDVNIEYHLVGFSIDNGAWSVWTTNKHISLLEAVIGLTNALAMQSGRDHAGSWFTE